ncbi:MAG: UDP-N-acetylglucosamine 2-epimerase, partial [Kiritimatiellae bacterium]|nr:UDP-N-acetylglucosamine 2-epimerase [Kiritimatiellia bacterium]
FQHHGSRANVLPLQVIFSGTMMLERFGKAMNQVIADGFPVDGQVYIELEGSVPATMAKTIGFGVIELTTELQRLQPDIVLLIGDRYEALAAAISSVYQNFTLAHIQGGEVSGSIDESARHAISKFAHYHFPATQRAAEYLVRMGEDPKTVFNVGCPVGDVILNLNEELPPSVFRSGVGAEIDVSKPYDLVIFHPVTTHCEEEWAEVNALLEALDTLRHPTVWLWPNIDAGADHISKGLRVYREKHPENQWLSLIKNLPPQHFHAALKKARLAIGNSSSFVRDTTFMGTPVVLVGNRQEGREAGANLLQVPCEREAIREGIRRQLARGRFEIDSLYGEGDAARKISGKLAEVPLYRQKRIHYIHDSPPAMIS